MCLLPSVATSTVYPGTRRPRRRRRRLHPFWNAGIVSKPQKDCRSSFRCYTLVQLCSVDWTFTSSISGTVESAILSRERDALTILDLHVNHTMLLSWWTHLRSSLTKCVGSACIYKLLHGRYVCSIRRTKPIMKYLPISSSRTNQYHPHLLSDVSTNFFATSMRDW